MMFNFSKSPSVAENIGVFYHTQRCNIENADELESSTFWRPSTNHKKNPDVYHLGLFFHGQALFTTLNYENQQIFALASYSLTREHASSR